MILPVSYWPLTLDEVREHYARVSQAVEISVCVYNNPWMTGVDMKPEFLAELGGLPNVDAVKESSADLARITAIRRLTEDRLTIIAGWESTSLQAFMAGARGWACVCANFLPRETWQFFDAALRDGDLARARSLWDRLFPVCEFIGADLRPTQDLGKIHFSPDRWIR